MADEDLPAPPGAPPAPGPGAPEGPADPPPSRTVGRWTKWFAGIGAVIILIGFAGTVIRLPYYSFSPGAALDLSPRVHITGAKTYPGSGPVMLLFVREKSRVNVWAWVQAALDPDIDLLKQEEVTGGQSPRQAANQDVCDMTQSKNAARAAALTALGYGLTVLPGVDVASFLRFPTKTGIRTFPAEKVLLPCDEIVAADGRKINRPEDLSKVVRRHRVGGTVVLRIVRDGKARTERVRVAEYEGRRIIGIGTGARLKFPVQVDVDTNEISGPSAGLAMALSIVDHLTPGDLTGGKRVAVTGTIAPDGTVGPIGAIEQKAISAKAAHAQIFLVPACGEGDAGCRQDQQRAKERVGDHVDVEPVRTLDEALRVLRKAGGAPVPSSTTTT